MGKKFILNALFILVLLLMLGFAIAIGPCPTEEGCELSKKVRDVLTSNGTIDLPNGTLVGGEPTNFITLEENKTMKTTEGPKNFTIGMKIDCDYEPWEPDPCDAD